MTEFHFYNFLNFITKTHMLQNQNEKLSEVAFSWRFPEYQKFKKTAPWYVISLIVLGLLIWLAIATSNPLFAVFLALFYLVVLMYEHRDPEMIDFYLTADGVKFGKNFYPYGDFDNFYVIYEEASIKNLYLEFKNPLRARLVAPLDDQDAVAIREFLLSHLKEDLEQDSEPFSEQFRRWLRL